MLMPVQNFKGKWKLYFESAEEFYEVDWDEFKLCNPRTKEKKEVTTACRKILEYLINNRGKYYSYEELYKVGQARSFSAKEEDLFAEGKAFGFKRAVQRMMSDELYKTSDIFAKCIKCKKGYGYGFVGRAEPVGTAFAGKEETSVSEDQPGLAGKNGTDANDFREQALLGMLEQRVLCQKRSVVDRQASLKVRFGDELSAWAFEKDSAAVFSGFNPVEHLWFIGYAGTAFFACERSVESQRRDGESPGIGRIIETLMLDPKSSVDFILTTPDPNGYAVQDAIVFEKLGNPTLKNGTLVFTTSFERACAWARAENSLLRKGMESGRCSVKFSGMSLPYAVLGVEYKPEAKKMGYKNHIKVDLYSPFLVDTNERVSLIVLEDSQPVLYQHFKEILGKINSFPGTMDFWEFDEDRAAYYRNPEKQ